MLSSRISNAWSLPHRRSIAGDKGGEAQTKSVPATQTIPQNRSPKSRQRVAVFANFKHASGVVSRNARPKSARWFDATHHASALRAEYIDHYALLRMTARTCDAS